MLNFNDLARLDIYSSVPTVSRDLALSCQNFVPTQLQYDLLKKKIALKLNESLNIFKIRLEMSTEPCQQTYICFISYPVQDSYEIIADM